MLELKNVYTNDNATITVNYNDVTIPFDTSAILSRRMNKNDLMEPFQFSVLNAYIEHKGTKFKDKLLQCYLQAETDIVNTIHSTIESVPKTVFHPVLDMFDPLDIEEFLVKVYKLPVPSDLLDDYDVVQGRDAGMTSAQTYTKRDYVRLVTLSLVMKGVIGPLSSFISVKMGYVSTKFREYTLYDFYRTHPTFKTGPNQYVGLIKLRNYVKTLIDIANRGGDSQSAVMTIERNISEQEVPTYMLSIVLIQKVALASIVKDNNAKNLVTIIYHFTNNKMRPRGDVSSKIMAKKVGSDAGTGNDEDNKESIYESYRILSKLTIGDIEVFNFAATNTQNVLNTIPVKLAKEDIAQGYKIMKKVGDDYIDDVQIILLTMVFKDLIPVGGFSYLKIDAVKNLLALGFAYLWTIGHTRLALLLTATKQITDNDNIYVNMSGGRNRLTEAIKQKLDGVFPNKRVVNETTAENLAVGAINEWSEAYFNSHWRINADEKYIIEAYTTVERSRQIPSDLKIMLAELILFIEDNRICRKLKVDKKGKIR